MPQQSEVSLKIPQFMFGHLPKNLKEFSDKRFEKTLNKYQDVIEEMEFRGKDVSDFKNYAKKYFIESIGHDSNSFFKNHITCDLRDTRNIGRQHNNAFISFVPHVNGSTIETLSSTNDYSSPSTTLYANQLLSNATVGQYYNQIAASTHTNGSDNIRTGCYDDNGSTQPNNLLADSGTYASDASSTYTFHSVTEFSVTTVKLWLALTSSGSSQFDLQDAGNAFQKTFSFGTLPNPYSSTTTYANKWRLKVGHS